MKSYSLLDLLSAQSAAFLKRSEAAELREMLRRSEALRRIRLGRRAYLLLHTPRLKTVYLVNFYATYRVPSHPFFPLFLSLKWGALASRAARAAARKKFIADTIASYPRDMLALLAVLASFDTTLLPRTKKRALEMASFSLPAWISFLGASADSLAKKHRVLAVIGTERMLALMLLECLPDLRDSPNAPVRLPSKAVLKAQFRCLSKIHHPDSGVGGGNERFLLVKKAFDLLSK